MPLFATENLNGCEKNDDDDAALYTHVRYGHTDKSGVTHLLTGAIAGHTFGLRCL